MIARTLEPEIVAALADSPVVLIRGPRQSGKSTLAKRFAQSGTWRYVTLDDPIHLAEAARDPGAFLDAQGCPLILDEVQRAPELMLAIKLRVDRDRKPGMYLLTGSANVLALPRIADSLAGRMEVFELLPLTQAELEGVSSSFLAEVFQDGLLAARTYGEANPAERMLRGGFPEPALRASGRREVWHAAYVKTLLERDVRDLSQISGLTQMPRLLSLLAARSGDTINISSLSRETGIPHTTLTRYLELLETLYLLQLVPSWHSNLGARFIKASKAYLSDSGLLCYLSRLDAKALSDRERLGPVLENFVANELARLCACTLGAPWLLHFRTVKHKEVSFVLESTDQRIVGIEVKAAASVQQDDFAGLRYLAEVAGDRFQRGVLLYLGTEVVPVAPDLVALPLASLWS